MTRYESVAFSGTRRGMTTFQIESVDQLLGEFDPSRAAHGMCVGADEHFHRILRDRFGKAVHVEGFPGLDMNGNGPKTRWKLDVDHHAQPELYLVRNHWIVLYGEVLVATPDGPERQRSGTWSTVRYARSINRPVYIVRPDGSIIYESDGRDPEGVS